MHNTSEDFTKPYSHQSRLFKHSQIQAHMLPSKTIANAEAMSSMIITRSCVDPLEVYNIVTAVS